MVCAKTTSNAKKKSRNTYKKDNRFHRMFQQERKSYLKKVAFTPVSCQLLDAGWKHFRMLGKSAKHHKTHQIKRYVFIC